MMILAAIVGREPTRKEDCAARLLYLTACLSLVQVPQILACSPQANRETSCTPRPTCVPFRIEIPDVSLGHTAHVSMALLPSRLSVDQVSNRFSV